MKKCRYYGIRYWSSNRSCTTGQPNKITGRYSIAANVEVFRSRADRADWMDGENLTAPCGCGGGERIAATKAECRKHFLGLSLEEFEEELESQEYARYGY